MLIHRTFEDLRFGHPFAQRAMAFRNEMPCWIIPLPLLVAIIRKQTWLVGSDIIAPKAPSHLSDHLRIAYFERVGETDS
jgi:hypothetical protein